MIPYMSTDKHKDHRIYRYVLLDLALKKRKHVDYGDYLTANLWIPYFYSLFFCKRDHHSCCEQLTPPIFTGCYTIGSCFLLALAVLHA